MWECGGYEGSGHLIAGGDASHHVFQVSNGCLLLEVPWEGLCPLSQQLEQFGTKLPDTGLQGKPRMGCAK